MQAGGALAQGLRCPTLHQLRPCTSRPARAQLLLRGAVNAQLGAGAASGAAGAAFGSSLPAPSSIAACSSSSSSSISSSGSSSLGRSSEESWLCTATGGGDGGGAGGSGGSGGGGSGGPGGSGEGEDGEEEYLDLKQAEDLAAAKGVSLPEDFAAAASSGGLRASVLDHYARLASGGALTSWLVRSVPAFRDRLIADRMFFFKVWAEVAIDSGCATVAELRKRGDDFWGEFEFYLSDLLVGLVLDVVLVTLLAPPAVVGRRKPAASGLKKLLNRLPSAVFEKSSPGRKFTLADRAGTYVKLGLEYSLAGIFCGFVGQGIANSMMHLKRKYAGASEHDVAVPPLVGTALVWGMFMGLSSNTRYQIVFGLERLVDETVARRIPQVAYFTTLAIRFVNNVIGGENFIDMARWAGVQ